MGHIRAWDDEEWYEAGKAAGRDEIKEKVQEIVDYMDAGDCDLESTFEKLKALIKE
jgi:hypothetical protein